MDSAGTPTSASWFAGGSFAYRQELGMKMRISPLFVLALFAMPTALFEDPRLPTFAPDLVAPRAP
jgi:hypothetical protein